MRNKIIILFICIIISGIVSCYFGPDGNWDLYAYHYYNGYAVLNGKVDYNIMPAGIQSFFNPLFDIITYLIITTFHNHKYFITFIQGITWGLLTFLIYLISDLLFSTTTNDKFINNILVLFSTIIGSTECLIVAEIGTSWNDIPTSVLVLSSLYFILKFLQIPKCKYIMISGIFAGIACGCKLTAAPFLLAMILTFAIFNFKKGIKYNLKYIFLYSTFATIGFLLIDGYWMFLLCKKFGNPFFPMFNAIFKSKYYTFVNYKDYRFDIINNVEILFYPLIWTYKAKNHVCEHYFFDFRHSFAYFSCIFSLILFFIKYKIRKVFSDLSKLHLFIILFSILSYLSWIETSSVARYLMPILALCGILILIIIANIKYFVKNRIFTTVLLLTLSIIINIKYSIPQWGRLSSIFEVPKLPIEDNSVVFLSGRPIAYVAANNTYKNVRFIFLYSGCLDGESLDFVPSEEYYNVVDNVIKGKKKYLIKRVRKGYNAEFSEEQRSLLENKYLKSKLKCNSMKNVVNNSDEYIRTDNFDLCIMIE